MTNGTSLAIILALTDIGWGIGILLSICEGSLKPCFYWFGFAIFLLMVGFICIVIALISNVEINIFEELCDNQSSTEIYIT